MHTLAVKVGKGWTASPNFSEAERLHSDIADSQSRRRGPERVKTPSWLGAMAIGPERRSRYSSPIMALPTSVLAFSLSVANAGDFIGAAQLQMVLQVFTQLPALQLERNACLLQHIAAPDARQFQNLRRSHSPGSENDFPPCLHRADIAILIKSNASCAQPLDFNART